jgi:hypothetical protein
MQDLRPSRISSSAEATWRAHAAERFAESCLFLGRRKRDVARSDNRGEGHPLLGRRMPDLDLVTADGELRVFHPAA